MQTTPANCHDGVPALALLDRVPAVPNRRGRVVRAPKSFVGDGAYGSARNIEGTRRRGIRPLLAPLGRAHGSGLGRIRWVVERTFAWFGHHRRLKLCYEKTGFQLQAFHELAAALICARRLETVRARF